MVGSDGHVYREGRVLTETTHARTGHRRVRLYGPNGNLRGSRGGTYANLYVHRLVCEAWWGPCPDECVLVRHLDGNSANNVPENLVWGTASENMLDYWEPEQVAQRDERRAIQGEHPPYTVDLIFGF
jgi:hypothetical protein